MPAPVAVHAQEEERLLGAMAKIGSFEVTVHGSKISGGTSQGIFRHEARPGATLFFVDFTVKNAGDRPKVLATHLWLEDASGRRFDPTPACQLATPEAVSLLEQLNPGLERRGRMCFEIPSEAAGLRFKFRDGFRRPLAFQLQ